MGDIAIAKSTNAVAKSIQAIAAFSAALSVRIQQAFPQGWAMTQNNLGSAYSQRILGEKAENIELAITNHTAALSVYTAKPFPKIGQVRKIISVLPTVKEF